MCVWLCDVGLKKKRRGFGGNAMGTKKKRPKKKKPLCEHKSFVGEQTEHAFTGLIGGYWKEVYQEVKWTKNVFSK